MANLVSYAFTTLSEVKESLEITDSNQDARLNAYINQATDMIERYCGRRFLQATYTDEIYSPTGGHYIKVRNYPITTLSTVDYSNGDFHNPNFTGLDPSLFALLSNGGFDSGLIYFSGHLFPNVNNWRVTYIGGYPLADIPWDLKEALNTLVAYFFGSSKMTPGLKSETLGRYGYVRETPSAAGRGPIKNLGLDEILDQYRTITV